MKHLGFISLIFTVHVFITVDIHDGVLVPPEQAKATEVKAAQKVEAVSRRRKFDTFVSWMPWLWNTLAPANRTCSIQFKRQLEVVF